MSRDDPPIEEPRARRDRRYAEAVEALGPALARLARAVERNPEHARDLEQDIHLALWRSIAATAGAAAATSTVLPAALIAAAIFAGIHWLNRAAARRLSAALAALEPTATARRAVSATRP